MKTRIRPYRHIPISLMGILTLFFALSCESVLFIELEESDRLIVLNGALSEDSLVSVQVSRTRHILDNANLGALENATVNLYSGSDLLEELLYEGNGYFRGQSVRPRVGESFRIEVENQGYTGVTAHCQIPPVVQINSVDTATVIHEYNDGYSTYISEMFEMDVSLQDPADVENYYLLSIEVDRSHTQWRDTTVQYIDSLFHNGDWHYFVADSTYAVYDIIRYIERPSLGSPDLVVEAYTSEGILFSDQLIDGKEYSIRATTHLNSFRSADYARVDLRFRSISESYYKYLKTRQTQYETKEDPFAVPVIVYSNVEGGTGFLGAYSSDNYTFLTFVPEFGDDYWEYYY